MVLCLLLGLVSAPVRTAAAEWPDWRGPHHNGVSTETGLVSSWSPEGENLIWKADFIGRSTPVVFDGRACVIGRVGEGIRRQERVACFSADDGRLLWEDRFNVYHTTVPFNRVGWASLAGDPETGLLYAHGVAGQMIAYDRRGAVVWSHFLTEEYGHLSGYGGRTQTPLVVGDQLIISFVSSSWGEEAAPRHRTFSFDKRSGTLLWVSTPGNLPYDFNTQSAPVVATIQGERLIVAGNADGWIYGLRAGTGEKVWGFQLGKRGLNSTVLVDGDRVYAAHSEENIDTPNMGRLVCFSAAGTGDLTGTHEIWRVDEFSDGFPSPTLRDGRLFAVDNSANLYSIDAATGRVAWSFRLGRVGKGSPVWADGKIYVTEVNGGFHILKPGPEEAHSLDLDLLRMPDGRPAEIYGSPAVAYQRVYFAGENGLYCLGNPARPFSTGRDREKRVRAEQGEGPPTRVQVVPAEALMAPGETAPFSIRAFDAKGRPLPAGSGKAVWALQGLEGSLDQAGRFTAAARPAAQAGHVEARLGGARATARVRVIPPLPWLEDFERCQPGESPASWVGARGKFVVAERDGGKVLRKEPRPRGLNRSATYMGPPSLKNYTIQADVLGTRKGRRLADIGLIAGGYTLDLQGAHQKLQVRSWASVLRMAQEVDFAWEPDTWYRIKLSVSVGREKATVSGKVWPRDAAEPDRWTIRVDDPLPIAGGSPGLVAYTPVDAYYDNIQVRVNE